MVFIEHRILSESHYLPSYVHSKLAAFAKEIVYDEQQRRGAHLDKAAKSRTKMRKHGEVRDNSLQ